MDSAIRSLLGAFLLSIIGLFVFIGRCAKVCWSRIPRPLRSFLRAVNWARWVTRHCAALARRNCRQQRLSRARHCTSLALGGIFQQLQASLRQDRAAALKAADDGAAPSVRLLSISLDGVHDTPAVLQAYAAQMQADPAIWRWWPAPWCARKTQQRRPDPHRPHRPMGAAFAIQ